MHLLHTVRGTSSETSTRYKFPRAQRRQYIFGRTFYLLGCLKSPSNNFADVKPLTAQTRQVLIVNQYLDESTLHSGISVHSLLS